MKSKQLQGVYDFGQFRLEPAERRLACRGEFVSLTPKEFELLTKLTENAGSVVEKNVLMETVWPDTFVEEATLTRNISWLRKKLAKASGDAEIIIETVPKLGYRILPSVAYSGDDVLIYEERTVKHLQIEETYEPAEQLDAIDVLPNPPQLTSGEDRAKPSFSIATFAATALVLVAIVAASLWFFVSSGDKTVIASSIVPFSGLPGREMNPTFSPDGKQIAYSWDGGNESGNLDIYVKLIGAGDPVRLTASPENESNPVFSPDGLTLVFVRSHTDHHEIVSIPALGGAERRIMDRASFASLSFSPDGRFLISANLELSTRNTGVFRIDFETGETKQITMPVSPAVDHTPRYSPDGKTIAFIRYFTSFHREVFSIPAEGGEPVQLTDDKVRVYGLAWHPGNRSLFFTSFRTSNRLNLWQLPVNGGDPRLISTGSREIGGVTVSPDGRTIAFVDETADENIWDLSAGKAARPIIRSTRADHSPNLSPDGKKIVFASDRTGVYEVWIADIDGRNQRQLSNLGRSSGSPRFSPDGEYVVYDAQAAEASDIFVVPVKGGASRQITSNGNRNLLPAFGAAGNDIFFVSDSSGSNEIWKIAAAGGDAVKLSSNGAFEMFGAPDGKTIVFSKGPGKTGLWSIGVDGGEEKPIDELKNVGTTRSWTISAKGLYFVEASIEPPFRLMFFDFASRAISEAGRLPRSPLLYYSNLSVSADGQTVIYAQQDQVASSIMFATLDN